MRDVRYLYYSELKIYAHQVAKRANDRLRRIEKAGLSEYSGAYIKRQGKRFSGFDKMTMPELRAAVFEMEKFMESKTSTISGMKSAKQTFEKRFDRVFTWDEYRLFWDMYENFKEDYYIISYVLGSDRVQQELSRVGQNGVTFEDVINKLYRMNDYLLQNGTLEGFND